MGRGNLTTQQHQQKRKDRERRKRECGGGVFKEVPEENRGEAQLDRPRTRGPAKPLSQHFPSRGWSGGVRGGGDVSMSKVQSGPLYMLATAFMGKKGN